MRFRCFSLASVLIFALAACESNDPEVSAPPGQSQPDAQSPVSDSGVLPIPSTTCEAPASYYTPRDQASAGKHFPNCVTDDNQYHQIQADVPSNARIAAMQAIGKTLAWDGSRIPSPDDFINARLAYTQPEGLDSRVQRREDIHYPAAPKACRDMTADEYAQYPDRCVGPAKLIPLLNDAFEKGAKGVLPQVQSARIEAALLWFTWVSFYKEGLGCGTELGQCDSTSSYWGGNQDRNATPSGGLGFYVRPLSDIAYQAGWDAVLAVRCWRDVDNPTGNATNAQLESQVGTQLDNAANHALALIVRQRLQNIENTMNWETVKILGGVLDFVATKVDANHAQILRTELSKTESSSVNRPATTAALEHLFPCP